MYRADGMSNVLAMYEEGNGSKNYGTYIPDFDLAEKYQTNGLFSKIIDRPAEEACKHGMDFNCSDSDFVTFLEDELDRLDWEEKAATAIRWARLFGGSIIVMLLDDGRGLEEPVNWEDVRSVAELCVFERAVVQPDPDTYRTGEATYFNVSSTFGSFQVHRSRCLVFRNGALPEYGIDPQYAYWGLPEYLRIKRDLYLTSDTHISAAKMLKKSVQPVYKVTGLANKLAVAGGDQQFLQRLEVIDEARGILNTIAIDKDGEEYEFKNFQLTGTKDIVDSACNLLSAVTNIPQAILFGRSPAGENATGESDFENYYGYVEGIQKRMLKKNIRALLKAIIKAGCFQGKIKDPKPIKPEFLPLWSMSEKEKTQIDLIKAQTAQANAQTAQAYIDMQVISPGEVREALRKSGQLDVEDILDNVADDDDGWEEVIEKLSENGRLSTDLT